VKAKSQERPHVFRWYGKMALCWGLLVRKKQALGHDMYCVERDKGFGGRKDNRGIDVTKINAGGGDWGTV